MSERLNVSSNPHIRSKATTNGIMAAVVLALLPAAGFGVYQFGVKALVLILVTVASTVGTETIGLSNANANPLAVAEPIRKPVKDPGPPATATASRVFKSKSIIFTTSSNMGSSVWE